MHRNMKILVADSMVIFAELLANSLKAQNCFRSANAAFDSDSAIKTAAKFRPNFILLDADLPDLGGEGTVQELLAVCPKPKILGWSIVPTSTKVSSFLGAGASGFVSKKTPHAPLLKAFEVVAGGSTYLCPLVTQQMGKGQKRKLTQRQMDVLLLITEGLSNKQIALKLGITIGTVETHRYNLMATLGVHSTAELLQYARTERLLAA